MGDSPAFVSFPLRAMTQSRDYRDPFTGLGVRPPAGAAGEFVLHEVGCLRYPDWNHRGIVSPYWRLHYNFAPGNDVIGEREVYPLRPDRVVLTPAGVRIDTRGRRAVRHLWVHFTPSWPGRPRAGSPRSVPIPPSARALAAELAASLSGPGPSLHHRARALLHAVFGRLEPGLFPTYPAPLARLLEEVQADPGREASVPALARRAGMSRSRFASWFRSHLGQAPAAWVRQVRVDHAARLLCLGDDSLEQIAADTGFPNRFHFTRVFTALAGLPPAAYRKRHGRAGVES